MKKLADFKTALALHVFPSYVNTWSSERRKAFEIMYNHAVFGRDVSKGKIIVEGANPGQGKSTLLDGIAVQSADQMLNMILITIVIKDWQMILQVHGISMVHGLRMVQIFHIYRMATK